ncbi:hypothetical protein HDU93_001855 [Gonapodya sp. JEL0774]|nr:hypothetical protein HDU93_001855 [Gonapodya sp. JEL0774]
MSSRVAQVASHVAAIPETQKSGFRYTLDAFSEGVLTNEEREFIEENGYIIRRKVIDEDFVKKLNERFNEYASGKREVPAYMSVMKDIGFLRAVKEGKLPRDLLKSEFGVYKVTNFDDLMYSWVQHPEMLKVAKCFVGADVKSLHHMYINKPPDMNQTAIHPLHQDMAYFPWTPAERTVGAWTALAHVNTQNGCIVVVPGSHKRGMLDHTVPQWMQNAGFHGVSEVADVQNLNDIGKSRLNLIAAELGPGDTLFFSPYLIHGSGVNRTDKCRKSIVCHYANAQSRFTPDHFEPAQDFVSQEIAVSLRRVKDEPLQTSRSLSIMNWQRTSKHAAGIDWREKTGDEMYL